jgi:hypothetical protein
MFVRGFAGLFHNLQRWIGPLLMGCAIKCTRVGAHTCSDGPTAPPSGLRWALVCARGRRDQGIWRSCSGPEGERVALLRKARAHPGLYSQFLVFSPLLLLTCLFPVRWGSDTIGIQQVIWRVRKLFERVRVSSTFTRNSAARYMPWSLFPERERTVPEINEEYTVNINNIGFESHVLNWSLF